METWSTLEQVIWSELGKVPEQVQEVPNLYTVCEELNKNQKFQEKQLAGLRSFARRVEQFLTQMRAGAVAPRDSQESPTLRRGEVSESLGYVPGASASSSAMSTSLLQTPAPPTVPAPPIQVRDIGSLIFETPIQHDYEAGVEVRSLLPTEQLEEIDDRLAIVDVDPATGTRFVKFWVDESPSGTEGSPAPRRERDTLIQETNGRDRDKQSPDLGGGGDFYDLESSQRERIPLGGKSNASEGSKGTCSRY